MTSPHAEDNYRYLSVALRQVVFCFVSLVWTECRALLFD